MISVHPLPLINISDHSIRCEEKNSAIGILLGTFGQSNTEILHSFELPQIPNEEFLVQRIEQMKKVDPILNPIGWYFAVDQFEEGEEPKTLQLESLHKKFTLQVIDNPIFMLVNLAVNRKNEIEEDVGKLPFKFYEFKGSSLEPIPSDSDSGSIKIEMTDEERLCVKQLTSTFSNQLDDGLAPGSMTQNFISSQVNLLELLLQRVSKLCSYLESSASAKPSMEQMNVLRQVNVILNSFDIRCEQVLFPSKQITGELQDSLTLCQLASMTQTLSHISSCHEKSSIIKESCLFPVVSDLVKPSGKRRFVPK